MRTNFKYILIFFCISLFFLNKAHSVDQFSFDVTEIEILENGNIVKGIKKGTIKTSDGITINSDTFTYDKKKNILKAKGNVEILDPKNKIIIFSENILYKKNIETITTNDNSKAIYDKNKIITAVKFKYQKNENILNATENVVIKDKIKNYIINTNDLTYFKNQEKIITKGNTESFIDSKYKIQSSNLTYLIEENIFSSDSKTKIFNKKSQVYHLKNFHYSISDEILKGNNILITTNYNLPKSDKFYFSNAIIDLKNEKFFGKDVKVKIHKTVFGNPKNDPRLKGVSAKADNNKTIVNKGIFTSCKENDTCPPWSLKSKKITHDKIKKQILYDGAVLNIYDVPVLYFPKFFHPDPTVERQTGFLKPELNSSNINGSSVTIPYFKVISENKDITFKPTIFDKEMIMTQAEYRQVEKNSNLIADFGYVNNYKSSTDKEKKNISHLFAKYDLDLGFQNFISSDLAISLERVSNDSYLKVFSPHITDSYLLRPKNFNKLENKFKIFLNHEKYVLESGMETFETLNSSPSDRYQYILPYYDLDWFIDQNYFNGYFNFNSNGANDLNNTNKLETSIINDLNYYSNESYFNSGIKSNYSINFKNLNSIGKNSTKYKSSPQIELISLFNAELSLPLIKKFQNYTNLLTPKLSFRFNPNDMKDYSNSNNKINIDNIFSTNRLGLSDTYETGRSITLGIDYKRSKKNDLNDINDYFKFKLATVLRDKHENFIPNKSSLNERHSNIFGSLESEISENINLGYSFSIDNDYSTFEYNNINATFSLNNIVTKFNFIEENNEVGDTNVISNSISYKHNDQNHFTFKTRRNRKINLTEYYDLVYEYKNDCLIAGVKYNKTYYSDGDLKPSENLLFTISLVPLTTYEYEADKIFGN